MNFASEKGVASEMLEVEEGGYQIFDIKYLISDIKKATQMRGFFLAVGGGLEPPRGS